MRRLLLCVLVGCGARSSLGTSGAIDAGAPIEASAIDAGPPAPKRVFVTREKWNGDLVSAANAAGHAISTGPDAADALCNDVASALGGTWRAWISDGTTSAIDRIHDVGPWFGLDGAKVFDDKAQLTSDPLAAILTDETGGITDLAVWTGTLADGHVASDTCRDWSSSSADDRGLCGFNNTTTKEKWSEGTMPACSGAFNLYCFEQ